MLMKHIVIAGTGFAGTWAAISAARAVSRAGQQAAVEIVCVSPLPEMHIRPRLYETAFAEMAPDVSALFAAIGVRHRAGTVETISTRDQQLEVVRNDGGRATLAYDRFILAAGSRVFAPDIPGLREFAFDVDQLPHAVALQAHLQSLTRRPETAARNTIVVVGGGFTGIETAAEMPRRLGHILGDKVRIRVVVLEQAAAIGPDLGPGPRPVIQQALTELGVEVITSARVAAIDAGGVTTAGGVRIETSTVVWTAGARANPLASQIAGEHDRFGRVHADAFLRAPGAPGVFVTGDVACVAADTLGNVALMSCQHALSLGRVAGHNAAAELVGLPLHPYSQRKYVTCLDLGPWGAVYTEGWDRHVCLQGGEAKALKREINTKWIYPPAPDREAAFSVANPDFVIVP
jgi:NADH dehydrogenase